MPLREAETQAADRLVEMLDQDAAILLAQLNLVADDPSRLAVLRSGLVAAYLKASIEIGADHLDGLRVSARDRAAVSFDSAALFTEGVRLSKIAGRS